MSRDNWGRLVEAVLRNEELREIARAPSMSSSDLSSRLSFSTISSDLNSRLSFSSPPDEHVTDSRPQAVSKIRSVPFLDWILPKTRLAKQKEKFFNPNASTASRVQSKTSNSSDRSSISIPSYGGKSSIEYSLPAPRFKSFSFNELKNATRNFRLDTVVIGEGGFGYVFKGRIDANTLTAATPGSGMVIAVKKLKPEGFQGHKDWLTEVNYWGQVHHPNLVKLIGYCSEGDNRLLVYEFMPKGSLDYHLFRRPQPLSWTTRMKVAIGAARGLSFLHEAEQQVIYRDFKACSILLDGEFNAKLSDFGLAKAVLTGDRTHVSTQVMGTQSYAAPEYVATGRLTAKSNVYSFGVVLLELLSGRLALDKNRVLIEQNLVDWAKSYLGDKRKLFRIMDIKLEGQYPQKEAFTAASIALQCISFEPKLRPRMAEVLAKLEELQSSKVASRHSIAVSRPSTDSVGTPLASPFRSHQKSPRVR